MSGTQSFSDQIRELISDNAWDDYLVVEELPASAAAPGLQGTGQVVRVRLSDSHPSAPGDIVNDYVEGVHPLEQVMQECLRSIRTGRPGA